MITVYGNWQASSPTPSCHAGVFDGGFLGGSASYTLCNGNTGSVTLNPQTTSKILCIQDGSITGNLSFQIQNTCV